MKAPLHQELTGLLVYRGLDMTQRYILFNIIIKIKFNVKNNKLFVFNYYNNYYLNIHLYQKYNIINH